MSFQWMICLSCPREERVLLRWQRARQCSGGRQLVVGVSIYERFYYNLDCGLLGSEAKAPPEKGVLKHSLRG